MLWVVVAALLFDAIIVDPDWLWRRLPHPVTLIGEMIAMLDRSLNRETWSAAAQCLAGILALIGLVIVAAATGLVLEWVFGHGQVATLAKGLIASTLIAQRSLYQHVARVRDAFARDIDAARRAVSMIVGRDPDRLDEPAVCRAAIESCAENSSDGIVAPVFWLALLGLPGLIVYKAINTADSMIGHRNARYENFGWAAARLDDLVNFIPARLSGMLIAIAAPITGGSISTSIRIMWRDARNHPSPNAGWPESAMAAALGLGLAGPRRYGDRVVDDAFLYAEGRMAARPDDIGRALKIFAAICAMQTCAYAALAMIF